MCVDGYPDPDSILYLDTAEEVRQKLIEQDALMISENRIWGPWILEKWDITTGKWVRMVFEEIFTAADFIE